MTDVLVERRLAQPVTDSGMQGIAAILGSCLGIHRVTWCASLLSTEGSEMFCHFRAADAESVRIAMRQSGAPPGDAWACRVQDAAGLRDEELAAVNAVVAHAFAEPGVFGARELHAAVDAGGFQRHHVRLLRSYLSADGMRMIGLYQAPDTESIRAAQREAGLPVQRVVPVRRYAP
ncbi:DUF4242 domain-containing protein [Variovorax sp. J22R133]|uniref:nickel-binding protein n=1 Tax=Variovorax brevis TaxID=3053503 RepID=UPI002577E482|nr:nickel-binding protein [Variovorax sp. J22R133]MDM0117738.1 DUF4242 domain-containing protein [Variovorax sp. J22R133]